MSASPSAPMPATRNANGVAPPTLAATTDAMTTAEISGAVTPSDWATSAGRPTAFRRRPRSGTSTLLLTGPSPVPSFPLDGTLTQNVGYGLTARNECQGASELCDGVADELLERDFGVAEARPVDGPATADQVLDRVDDVPDVDVHARGDDAVAQPEGDELARGGIPAEDHLLVARGEPRVLHADVVLVGEEVREPLVRGRLAEHRAGRRLGLVQRVGPVLHPEPAAVERVEGVGHVADREDARLARLQALVDEDAVVHRKPRLHGELGARQHTEAGDDEVRLEPAAVGQSDTLDAAGALEAGDADPGEQLDAVLAVEVGVDLAELGAQHALERQGRLLDERDVDAALPGGGGDFGTDPAAADDHCRAAAPQAGGDGVRVREVAQVVDAIELRAGDRQAPRLPARGEDEPVVGDPLAGGEPCLTNGGLDPVDGGGGPQLDLVVVVERLGVDASGIALGLAPQVVLGERGSLVGQLGLLADEDDPALEALRAQRLGGLGAGKRGADDQMGLGIGHVSPSGGEGGSVTRGLATHRPGFLPALPLDDGSGRVEQQRADDR